ncbi:MAG: NOB1 family endonuclease [Nitrososphaeria archaeon]
MIYVLDASALIFDSFLASLSLSYTTDEVIEEVSKGEIARTKIDVYLSQGKIKVMVPPKEYFSKVTSVTINTADFQILSKADLSIIALALYLKDFLNDEVMLVTDDYAVQNIAVVLGMKFRSLTVKGIMKRINWMIYCPACGKIFKEAAGPVCPICGHNLKRKPREETPLR